MTATVLQAERLKFADGYDKTIRPFHAEAPATVKMNIHVGHWGWENQQFMATIYLRHFWSDKRIDLVDGDSESFTASGETLQLGCIGHNC